MGGFFEKHEKEMAKREKENIERKRKRNILKKEKYDFKMKVKQEKFNSKMLDQQTHRDMANAVAEKIKSAKAGELEAPTKKWNVSGKASGSSSGGGLEVEISSEKQGTFFSKLKWW